MNTHEEGTHRVATGYSFNDVLIGRLREIMPPSNGRSCAHAKQRNTYSPACCECRIELSRQTLAATLLKVSIVQLRELLK